MPSVPVDPLIRYTTADLDEQDTHVRYYGAIDGSGRWYIRKTDDSTGVKQVRYAFGPNNYATNWAGRAALTYSLWGT
jgi:hypothetical protein